MGKISGSGSGMHIFIIFPKQFFELKYLKFFYADPDPGSGDPFDPGSGMEKIRIRYPG
jgi:hypothetical protein